MAIRRRPVLQIRLESRPPMHVLVLGAYGLIGQEITRALVARGHRVTGLARSAAKGRAVLTDLGWIEADLARLTTADAWAAAEGAA